ncbi:helix-turn-helix transcriptional regulator [Panacagrimonas sp.]|uniref:helix-turn-helix transcriptional regulator n=1 Tax=Panacagrimonas sp. TaxID=2480088 RepID=UPI003B5240B1
MGLGWGEFVGVTGDNAPHSHHAVQVLLSEHPQPLWTAASGWQDVRGVLIGPELSHQLDSNGEPVRLIYVEPHSDAGRRLMTALDEGLRVLTTDESKAAQRALETTDAPDRALAELMSPASEESSRENGDSDIETWITALPTTLPDRLTAADCARQLGLSSSRFLHRFRAHTGLPLRPYLRWRRLLVALRAAMQGASLTDAAHAAGFSDAAHFTRTFRRHFGMAPSALTTMASPK